MNNKRIIVLVKKDWKELFANKMALIPMIILPLIFAVVLPIFMVGGLTQYWHSAEADLAEFLTQVPTSIFPQGLSPQQQAVYATAVLFLAPFFLIIPVMVASVIAGNSLVGEKERKTIEGLLYTPITETELLMAKVLSALVPAMAVTWISFIVYTLTVHIVAFSIMPFIFFPNLIWWIIMIFVVPTLSFIAICLIIIFSERAKSYMEAQQLSAFLIIPLVLVLVGQSSGLLYLSVEIVIGVSVVLAIIAYAMFKVSSKRMRRERLASWFS